MKLKTHHEFSPVGFGLAPTKNEGDVANPDTFTWECGNPSKCDYCSDFYAEWKRRYTEQYAEQVNKIRIRIMQEAYNLADKDDSEGYNSVKVACSDVLTLVDELVEAEREAGK